MATSTFDRKIAFTDPDSLQKLADVMRSEAPEYPLSSHPFSASDREKGETLLRNFLNRDSAS